MTEVVKEPRDRILVVEDDAEIWQRILDISLRKRADVIIVSSAQEARDVLEKEDFTRVISDGLEGDFIQVHEAATKAGVHMKLLSDSVKHKRLAEKLGIEFVDKWDLDPDTL